MEMTGMSQREWKRNEVLLGRVEKRRVRSCTE